MKTKIRSRLSRSELPEREFFVSVSTDGRRRNCLKPFTKEQRREHFLARVEKQENGCWLWMGAVSGSGLQYGVFHFGSRVIRAHRYAYEEFTGNKIPKHMEARHVCDTPLCVNPDHIIPGTRKQNSDDKMQRGRNRCGVMLGEKNPRSKITLATAMRVVELRKEGMMHREIADETGVSRTNIGAILQGRTWGHATGIEHPICSNRSRFSVIE